MRAESIIENELNDADKLLKDGILLSNKEMITKALEAGAAIKSKDKFGQSLFSLALTEQNEEVIKIFIKAGASKDEALFSATIQANVGLIKMALSLGANPNALNKADETPLHYICQSRAKNNDKLLPALQALILMPVQM